MVKQKCWCGRPLHYSSARAQAYVERMVAMYGETIVVNIDNRSWRVPRHYIALHGISAETLPSMGFEEITKAD